MTIIIAVLVFTVLVVIHEFGHFLFARLAGIKVEEFAVGMGPKIWGYQGKETLYSIRALPLGGFCRMLGEDERNDDPKSFNSKPIWRRISVIVFGPLMNLALALLILSLVYAPTPVISAVRKDLPAAKAGIVAGEKVVEIQGKPITEWKQIKPIITENIGKQTLIKLETKGATREVTVTPVAIEGVEGGIIGIDPGAKLHGFSLAQGVYNVSFITTEMVKFLGKLIAGQGNMNEVVGPIGIVHFVGESTKTGLPSLLNLTALLSLNLFIVNLIPFPALDGGRLIFLIIEGVRRKPVDPQKEGFVHFVGFVLLMMLSAVILYRDFLKFVLFKS